MRRLSGAVVVMLMLAGCTSGPGPPAPDAASGNCPAAATGPPRVAVGGTPLPTVTLPCFVGGRSVELARLGRPTVINFWASSCAPCRDELPELQRFADEAQDVVVVGVVTGDRRDAAESLIRDLGLTFPCVDDPDSTLLRAVGRNVLPVTLFVDSAGVVRYEDVSGALTFAKLRKLAVSELDAT